MFSALITNLYAEDILELIVEYNHGEINIISYTKTTGKADIKYDGDHILSVTDRESRELFFTTFDIPLLLDVPPDPYTGESYQIRVERNSTVVRIPYTPYISGVRINSSTFSIKTIPFATPLPAPATEVIYGNCTGTGCFDFFFVADNYGSNLSQFKTDAQTIANYFGTIEPFKSNLDRIKITRVDNTTSLGCYNNCSGIQRLICCDSNKVFAAVSGLSYDEILVITNMNEYGGSGYVDTSGCADKNSYAVTFRDTSYYAKEVAVHETGHSFGGLWDEYEYGTNGSGDGPNCVHDSTCAKWKGVAGTGCYAGCSYNGMYRPTDNGCLMRTLTPTGGYKFCPVCKNVVDAKLKNCFSSSCTPSCTGKECGDDGCGGSCGSCTSVPADYCLNSTTLRDYSGTGTCSSFKCTYPYTDKTCQYGCANGKCNTTCTPSCTGKECGDDGCGGSCGGCSNPPADYCLNSTTLRDYTGFSSCVNNKCDYKYKDTTCTSGCANGKCLNCVPDCTNKQCGDDGCGGSCGSCNNPPPDVCIDIQTLRDYSPYGTCNNNICEYPYTDKKCSYMCEQNKCITDPYADAGIIPDTTELKDIISSKDISNTDTTEIKDVTGNDTGIIQDKDTGKPSGTDSQQNNSASDNVTSGCSCSIAD